MKTEKEIRERLKLHQSIEHKKSLPSSTELLICDYGEVATLKWVLEED